MAIKGLPRDATAGQLRETKLKGFSDSGMWSTEYIRKRVVSDPYIYFNKLEPGGQVVSKVEEVIEDLNEAAGAIAKAGGVVRDTAKQTIEAMTDDNRKLRDNTNKLNDSIGVFLKSVAKPEYTKAVSDIQKLAEALEKIAELEKAGLLAKLTNIMKDK